MTKEIQTNKQCFLKRSSLVAGSGTINSNIISTSKKVKNNAAQQYTQMCTICPLPYNIELRFIIFQYKRV